MRIFPAPTWEASAMADRYFLYIDILGFADLVGDKNRIREIYRIVDDLNVHNNRPYFRTIVFSDTILVYSDPGGEKTDPSGSIMWMCEWAQDLFVRFVPSNMHFRAILTLDDFEHEEMKHIEAFYGQALVRTYRQEKSIQGMGLYIDNKLLPHCDIFHTSKYNADLSYVHLMQSLEHISQKIDQYPIFADVLTSTDMQYFNAANLVYLRNIYKHMNNLSLSPYIRSKYLNTWHIIRARHTGLLDLLAQSNFNFTRISDLDWDEPIRRAEIGDTAWA